MAAVSAPAAPPRAGRRGGAAARRHRRVVLRASEPQSGASGGYAATSEAYELATEGAGARQEKRDAKEAPLRHGQGGGAVHGCAGHVKGRNGEG